MNHHTKYESHYRSLFRAILRGIRNIRSLPSAIGSVQHPNKLVQREIAKSSINPDLYHRHLLAEIRQSTWEEFSKSTRHLKDAATFTKLSEGQALVRILGDIHKHPNGPEGWGELIEALVEYRSSQLRKYHWRQQYDENKSSIDLGRLKVVPTLLVKRIISREQKAHNTQQRYSALSTSQKTKAYDDMLAASKENASFVLRNYLKRLQLMGKLPNPYKLPYVRTKMLEQSPDLPQTREILPGSTKRSVMKDAYDMEYIESIIKPEIEYRINESHFLKKYTELVNEKGPYKVHLRSTMSGVMPAHYLKLPFNQLRSLEALAMDIKKSARSARKQFVWNLDSAAAKAISEKRHGEGYAVRGSGGFSIEEIMFPRSYYEKLAAEEAAWEFRIEMLQLEANWDKTKTPLPNIDKKLKGIYEALIKSWEKPLMVATREIDEEVHQYYKKYRVSEDSEIWTRRSALQEEMNAKHTKLIENLEKLSSILQKNQVNMHSDLFNLNRSNHKLNESRIIQEEKLPPNKRRGIPEGSGSGLGYTLGDFMEKAGLKRFKMGEKFDRRLSFVGSAKSEASKRKK